MPPPDSEARYEILCVHTRSMKLGNDVNLRRLAEDTERFTGAELEGLCNEAGIVALREDISATVVCDRHFQIVRNSVNPALSIEEIDSYSSFMKTTSSAFSRNSESSSKLDRKRSNRKILGSMVKFGIISCILVAATKYCFMHEEQSVPEVAVT